MEKKGWVTLVCGDKLRLGMFLRRAYSAGCGFQPAETAWVSVDHSCAKTFLDLRNRNPILSYFIIFLMINHFSLSDEDILNRIMACKPEGRRRIGRPKLRWIDGVLEDIKKLGVTN